MILTRPRGQGQNSGYRPFANYFLPAVIFAAGCSPVYVYKSWRGHARLLSGQRPIRDILADPAAPEDLKAKLKLVEEVRSFAFETMGLPLSKSYTAFAAVPGNRVTTVVSASRKTSFEAYQWWFPIVGRVPYKGYFDEKDALKEEAGLKRRGYDIYVFGAAAYSTLGWGKDPVLSTMIQEPPAELAAVLIHELTHAAVFFKGSVDFNEALATFIGEQGSSEFIRRRFGEDSPQRREAREASRRAEDYSRRMDAAFNELEALYASTLPDSEKLARREAVFKRAGPGVNNAVILASRRYRYDLSDFRAAYDRFHGRWPEVLAFFRSLDGRRPRQSLRERLGNGPP